MKHRNKSPVDDIIEEIDSLIGYCSIMEYKIIEVKLTKIKQQLKEEIMSFSTPVVSNPAKRFIEFKSAKKQFVYYDKESGSNVEVALPFSFVVLDELSTISGYSDTHECSIFSNEVKNITTDELTVKSHKGGFREQGLYNDIKGNIKAAGGKFAKSLYCLDVSTGDIVNLKLDGAAMSTWIDAKLNTHANVIHISKDFEEKKKGATVYSVPVFEATELIDAIHEDAVKADQALQVYFKAKFAKEEGE